MVKCPRCGYEIKGEPARPKGTGKKTGLEQTRLSRKQIWTITILAKMGARTMGTAVPRQSIYEEMREQCRSSGERFPSTHIVGFWLSALLGAGFVSMINKKCELKDTATRDIRFRKKPCWHLSDPYQEGLIGYTDSGEIIHMKQQELLAQ